MNFFTVNKLWCALLLSMVMAGCGGGEDGGANPNDNNIGGGNLVCADGEAWIKCEMEDGEEFCMGYMFKSNGDLIFIDRENNGVWSRYPGREKWRIDGNSLIIYDDENEGIVTYSLTRNALTLTFDGKSQIYTKKSDVYPILTKSRADANLSKFVLSLKR